MIQIKWAKNLLKNHLSENTICQIRHYQKYAQFNKLRSASGKFSLREFDRYKCIFIHIPKTAGTSVSWALFGSRGGGHKSARHYKQVFGLSTFRRYFKFTFVRNPYSRLHSAYHFLMRGGHGEVHEKWVKKHIIGYKTFEDFVMHWVNRNNIYKRCHFVPQYLYLSNKNMELEVDFIGRFENLEKDFQAICSKLNISTVLPHFNSNRMERHWRSFYNDKMLRIVEEVYYEDFTMFDYEFLSKKYTPNYRGSPDIQ